MMFRSTSCFIISCLLTVFCGTSGADETTHRLITQGNGKLAIVDKDGTIEWEMPWGGIHDIHVGSGSGG